MDSPLRRLREVSGRRLGLAGVTLLTVALFLFAVQLLGAATDATAPVIRVFLDRFVAGDASALGFSWLVTYLLTNGSVVAALAVSLFSNDLLPPAHLFLMVAGSRLGSAAVVVLVGAADYVQKRGFTLRHSVRMGLLTFLITHSIYLPATVVGYASLPHVEPGLDGVARFGLGATPVAAVAPVTDAITARVGAAPAFLLAFALLFGSLNLFDRVLSRVETESLRRHLFRHFERTWVAVVAGFLITAATTSVAFSLGVVVPLYNREYVKRAEVVPYVLGANLGTLFDTLVVAVVLDSPAAVTLVVLLLGWSTVFTLLALARYRHYGRAVDLSQDRLLGDRRAFAAFVGLLVLVPLVLLAVR